MSTISGESEGLNSIETFLFYDTKLSSQQRQIHILMAIHIPKILGISQKYFEELKIKKNAGINTMYM